MTIPDDQYRAALGAVEYPPLTAEGRVSYMEQTAIDVVLAVTPLIEKALRARLYRVVREVPVEEPAYPVYSRVPGHELSRPRHPALVRDDILAAIEAQ